jgi:hypothetical protein
MSSQAERTQRALNILAKWRAHFAGWQLGTRLKGDPESDALRDHREATILLRAELSALTMLLINREVFTQEQWLQRVQAEAEELCQRYEQRWPGARASLHGMHYDVASAKEWMKDWRP